MQAHQARQIAAHGHSLPFSMAALAAACVLSACGGGDATAPAGTTDTTPPTVTITDNVSAASATGDVTFTFTFSENTGTSFAASDITVTGGTKGTFTLVSGTSATLVVSPAADSSGTIAVSVAASAFTDQAGNANTAAATASQDFNTVVVSPGSTGNCTTSPCVDFSATGLAINGFGALTADVANDPVLATNKVARYVKTAASETWAGATLDTSGTGGNTVTPFGFATSKVVTLRVYSPAVGEVIMLKVENAGDGGVFMEAKATTTKANAWETLTFDYAAPTNGTFNSAATYNRVSIFPHFDAKVTADTTYYFDELSYTAGSSGGGSSGGSGLTNGVFASNFAGVLDSTLKSTEGGDAGRFVDTSAPQVYAWGGEAPNDTPPSFYFGYGFNGTGAKATYMGAFVKAPANGSADLSSYTNLKVNLWGNAELINPQPTVQVVLQGKAVAGCGSNSGASEVQSTFKATTITGADAVYTLPLSAFTVKYACSGETTAAQVLGNITQINYLLLDANIQYTNKDANNAAYPNGLNIGPIKLN